MPVEPPPAPLGVSRHSFGGGRTGRAVGRINWYQSHGFADGNEFYSNSVLMENSTARAVRPVRLEQWMKGAALGRCPSVRQAIPRPKTKTPTRRNAYGRQVRCLTLIVAVRSCKPGSRQYRIKRDGNLASAFRVTRYAPDLEDQVPAPSSIRGRNHASNPASGRNAQMRKTVSTPWLSANTPRIAAAMPPSPKFRP